MNQKLNPDEKKNLYQNWEESLKVDFVNPQSLVSLIKYPVITEKTYISMFKNKQYTFDVDPRLTKSQIKKMFERVFGVNVISVNTHLPPRKRVRLGLAKGYRPRYKRAILTLKEGQCLDFANMTNI